ncbi:NUDIX domain-containing protein [Tardiphaga sp. 367_B4_N1_1]|uniref:NUDIX domain-containing protein n=1 Tax=Tardiphaga sp. 367_B4_N1_1 TaxID=3240777 RepID=UPI003F2538CA
MVEYKNNPTVCCVLLWLWGRGVVLIRRGLPDGYGKLALPGGFQNHGEDMHVAAARELKEETGITVDPSDLTLSSGGTDEYGHNVLFFTCNENVNVPPVFLHDDEVLEVVTVKEPVDTAYPMHTEAVRDFIYGESH